MEIIFVGTGSGKASLNRYHSSFLIMADHNLLIDAGDGISFALLNSGIDYNEIDTILFSHFHPDHLTGIPSLLNQMKMNGREKELLIISHINLGKKLKNFIETALIFPERLGFEISFKEYDYSNHFLLEKDLSFLAAENSHLFKLSKQYPELSGITSSSFLFNIKGTNLFYTGDVGGKQDLELFNTESPDYIICECTHIDLHDILSISSSKKPKKLFITHITDEIKNELNSWHKSLNKKDKEIIVIANDNLRFKI